MRYSPPKHTLTISYSHNYGQKWEINPLQESEFFYCKNYEMLGSWTLRVGEKRFLGGRENRTCRFCSRSFPKVTFRKEAHALPESIGNKSLFTFYECDTCNLDFGQGIEDAFGKWSKPMRNLSRIRGKGGIPKLKGQSGWRLEANSSGIELWRSAKDEIIEINEAKNTVTFKLPRDPYVPIAVLKAFVKMGLSLMPDAEMPNFAETVMWLATKDHTRRLIDDNSFHVCRQFTHGPILDGPISVSVYRRRSDAMRVPYAFMEITYANEHFQVFLPSLQKDNMIYHINSTLYWWPIRDRRIANQLALVHKSKLDFTRRETLKGDIVEIVLAYEQMVKEKTTRSDSWEI